MPLLISAAIWERKGGQTPLTFEVQKGGEFGVVLGGSNFDSTSTIQGTKTISDFTITARKRMTAE